MTHSYIYVIGGDEPSLRDPQSLVLTYNTKRAYMEHPEGFEPPTVAFEARSSNPLSYRCLVGRPGIEPGVL